MKIENLLSEFYHSEGFQTCNVPYDRDSMLDLALRLIINDECGILINEKSRDIDGVLGFHAAAFPFNYKYHYLSEDFWYSSGISGIKLLKVFIEMARKVRVNAVQIASIFGMNYDKIQRVLYKLGFSKVESSFIKEIV